MAETHDTIDGLLAEFRGYSAGMPPSYNVTMSWHDFRVMLDRFDAAHKREVREAVTDCNQFGDCAKLREALESLMIDFDSNFADDNDIASWCDVNVEIVRKARAALSSPPRNCDKVKTSWDVLKEWHEGLDTANDIVRMLDWLLAPATEKEGGAND